MQQPGTEDSDWKSKEIFNLDLQRSGCVDRHKKVHTTPGIPRSSPTRVLVWLSLAYLWESGRDPEFSSGYGRMYQFGGRVLLKKHPSVSLII